MRLALTLLITLGLPAALPGAAVASEASSRESSPSAISRLERLPQALRDTPFRGRSLYLSGDQLTTVEIVHGVIDGETRERVVHLSGEPAEIVRKGDRVACLHPDAMSEMKESRPVAVSAMLSTPDGWKASTHYRVSEGGVDRVAGRVSHRVDLVPQDQHRHGLQLWLDDASGLLLKSVILDRRGQALDVFEFVSLETGIALQESDFRPGDGLHWLPPEDKAPPVPAEEARWAAGWLPAGFEKLPRALRSPGQAAFAQSYSDGLAAFSVFVEPLGGQRADEGSRQWGASVAVSRRASAPAEDQLVTVVGEIPLETAIQVAASVRPASRP